ncbi:DHA1 family inner membrane transport protein [Luteibacter sp. Sphag1AF]|uniref:MFS transporter n=1 Tax=Luteibacter sp. Sphag1AF TaxID=2587031 RepID=UPI001609467F|nr:MFS transporter [Luteibacter sp. Sphag1AF]MBB3225962.1 DHA1 family inner membrane transport protein [Luteibacter sp. Sphag1AF]
MYLPLLALAIAAFGIGTTEFVIMGLLPEVASDLHVSAPAAGMLVSGYAIGVAIGAPVLALVTARWPRRKALLTLIAFFILGNALCAIAPTYELLMAARVVTAFCHAAFFGIGAVVAADLVPERRAQAVALMFTGLTLANVLGVPFGTALGQVAGWRSTFMAVTVIGLAAAVALAVWLPKKIPMQSGQSLLSEFRAIATPRVQMALLVSTLASVSMFTVFTYIAYILRDVTHFSEHAKSWVLLLFGAGITVGGLVGGKLADWKLMPVLASLFVCNAVILAIFAWTSHFQIATLVTMFVWGVFSFAVVPAAQVRVLDQARGAPNLASTLNQGAFNVGNATGAWLGGMVIGAGLPLTNLPLLGAFIALGGLAVVVASALYDRRGSLMAQA